MTKELTYISWFINLFEPMKIHNFLPNGVSGGKNFKYKCSGFMCCVCCWSVWVHCSYGI